MKGLKFNEFFRYNFGRFLGENKSLIEYLDEKMSSKHAKNEYYYYTDDEELSKDVFINWQRERFSDQDLVFYNEFFNFSTLTPDDKEFQCGLFADKNDKDSNNYKIAEMIIDPVNLAQASRLNKAYGYDSLIDSNIRTAVASGANIYQALSYLAEAGNKLSVWFEKNKDFRTPENIESAKCFFAAEQNLLRYEKASPYSRLYKLTERLQDLQYQEEHSDHLSNAEYEKLQKDIWELEEKIDNEILEFNPNELKLINDSGKTYFDLAANPEKTWESSPNEQLRIKNYSPEMKQCTYVARRIQSLERQNKFNNENDMENE